MRTKPIRLAQSALSILLLAAAFTSANADIVVVAPTGSTSGSFSITQDITFTLTNTVASGRGLTFVLDEWVTSDGSQTEIFYSPNLSISINGGAPQTFNPGNFGDNLTFTDGAT